MSIQAHGIGALAPIQVQILSSSQTEYIGLVSAFPSPFNLYLKLEDLGVSESVPFIVYTLGSRSVLAWGEYDTVHNKFLLHQACRSTTSLISSLSRGLANRGFEYVANTVEDRIIRAMGRRQLDSETYTRIKYMLAVEDGELTLEQVNERFIPFDIEIWWEEWVASEIQVPSYTYLENPELVDAKRVQFVDRRRVEVIEYEETVNRTDVDREVLQQITAERARLLVQATGQFAKWVTSSRLTDTTNLQLCVPQVQCGTVDDPSCDVYTLGEVYDLR